MRHQSIQILMSLHDIWYVFSIFLIKLFDYMKPNNQTKHITCVIYMELNILFISIQQKILMTCKWKKDWKYCFFFDVWAMYANMIICRVIPQKETEINIGYQLLLYFVKCSSQGYCYKNPNYLLFVLFLSSSE